MSWDIYGNPLQRGHCEVHPHVHEEYPCSVCLSERRQHDEANRDHQAQHDMILEVEHLKMQRDELLEAAKAVVTRWDTPNWKDAEPTAAVIGRLRAILQKIEGCEE